MFDEMSRRKNRADLGGKVSGIRWGEERGFLHLLMSELRRGADKGSGRLGSRWDQGRGKREGNGRVHFSCYG